MVITRLPRWKDTLYKHDMKYWYPVPRSRPGTLAHKLMYNGCRRLFLCHHRTVSWRGLQAHGSAFFIAMYKLKMFIAITAFVAVGSLLVLLHFSSAWRIPTVRSQRRANRGEGSSGTAVLIVPSETTASHHSDIASFNNSEKTIDDFIVSALNEQSDPTTASPLDGESALATPESTRETNGIMSGKKEGLLEVCPDVRSSLGELVFIPRCKALTCIKVSVCDMQRGAPVDDRCVFHGCNFLI